MDCQSVDPANRHLYFNTMAEVSAVREVRLEDYVQRHGLASQFLAEDTQGKGR